MKLIKTCLIFNILFLSSTIQPYCTKNPTINTKYEFDTYIDDFTFSPNGKYLAVLFWNNTLQIFDISIKNISFKQEKKHVKLYKFSSDSKYLGIILWDGNFQLLDMQTEESLLDLGSVKNFKFSKSNNHIAMLFESNKPEDKHIIEVFDIE
ncbi:hypothetical protein ACFLYA_00450 [Candidatus Dependentiae bacterium]